MNIMTWARLSTAGYAFAAWFTNYWYCGYDHRDYNQGLLLTIIYQSLMALCMLFLDVVANGLCNRLFFNR